jgi:hypothetical protein
VVDTGLASMSLAKAVAGHCPVQTVELGWEFDEEAESFANSGGDIELAVCDSDASAAKEDLALECWMPGHR